MLGWIVFYICAFPEVQQKMLEEIKSVCGDRAPGLAVSFLTIKMKQYEKKYNNFRFLGPSPINYDYLIYDNECVWNELCNLLFKKLNDLI